MTAFSLFPSSNNKVAKLNCDSASPLLAAFSQKEIERERIASSLIKVLHCSAFSSEQAVNNSGESKRNAFNLFRFTYFPRLSLSTSKGNLSEEFV